MRKLTKMTVILSSNAKTSSIHMVVEKNSYSRLSNESTQSHMNLSEHSQLLESFPDPCVLLLAVTADQTGSPASERELVSKG